MAVIFRQRWEGFQILAKRFRSRGSGHEYTGEKRGWAPCAGHRPYFWANGGLVISPGAGGIHQLIQELKSHPRPRIYLRRLPIGHSPRVKFGEPRSNSLAEGQYPRMGLRVRNFECVTLWRFGNRPARPETSEIRGTDQSLLATSDSGTILLLRRFWPPTLP